MEQTVFELDLLEEARDFLKSLTYVGCGHSRHCEEGAKNTEE